MNLYDLETKNYCFFGFSLNLLESIKILKDLKNSLCIFIDSLETFSYEIEECCSDIQVEDYIDNALSQIEENFDFEYESIEKVILSLALHTDYKIEDIKKKLQDIILEIKEQSTYDSYEEKLNECNVVEALLLDGGAKDIQIFFDDESEELIVRYLRPLYEKKNNKFHLSSYENFEIGYSELKDQLLDEQIEILKQDVEYELNNIVKNYKDYGSDEKLTKEQKIEALHNTYENIEEAFINVITRKGKMKKMYAHDFFIHVTDSLLKLKNDILGGKNNRYKTELLNLMKKEGLNQIAKNNKGQYHYVHLFKVLTTYYNLLGNYKKNLKALKYFDDGVVSGYMKEDDIPKDKKDFYEFYKIAKFSYKHGQLYGVYFSFIHNVKKISFTFLKKAFRATKLQKESIQIHNIPVAVL